MWAYRPDQQSCLSSPKNRFCSGRYKLFAGVFLKFSEVQTSNKDKMLQKEDPLKKIFFFEKNNVNQKNSWTPRLESEASNLTLKAPKCLGDTAPKRIN